MTLFPTQPNMPPKPAAARPAAVPTPSAAAPLGADDAKRARALADSIRARFAQTLVGQDNLRESLIVTLVAGGHILIESVPGLAKTTAAQTLATCVSGSFKRVQCTPDLMPSDLVGTQVFDFASQKFTTQIGPIHANFVLLDEINRSNAKTQSAMLEAMAEGTTTIGGQRIALPKPFMVIATENPIEEEGTFNLPEAQMDRFMMKAVMTYPTADQEARMLAMLTRRGSDMIGPGSITGERITVADVDFLRTAA
ncbi:MoxR protein, partial [Bifidobacterium breve]